MVVYLGKATPASGSGGGSGDVNWGNIGGTLADQTDLANALAEKQDVIDANNKLSASYVSGLATVATTGAYSDLSGTPSIPAAQVNSDWNAVSGVAQILNKPTIPTVPENDNTTISLNASDELQAIGVKEARTDTAIRLWHGTEEQWEQGGASQTWYNWEVPSSASWTNGTITASLPTLAFGNGNFVATNISYSTGAGYSTDGGATWTASTLPNSTDWTALAYGNNKFVALSESGTYAAVSTDDGATWTSKTALSSTRNAMCFGNNMFIAVSGSPAATKYIYSSDGENWSEGNFPTSLRRYAITYGNGKFVTVSFTGDEALYSSDGINWTQSSALPVSASWHAVAYGNGKFVAVASGYDDVIISEDNGATWTAAKLPSSAQWNSIAYGNGYFVTIASFSDKSAYSKDGIHWEPLSLPSSAQWTSVAFGNGKFVVTASAKKVAYIQLQDGASCFTSEAEPTTESTVYSAPNVGSVLTITAVGTGTITLSDTNTYNYNSGGNQTTYQSIGEAYPNYVCFIDGVGIKIGNTLIATANTVDQTYDATSANAQSGVAVASGIADTLGTIETALQGV